MTKSKERFVRGSESNDPWDWAQEPTSWSGNGETVNNRVGFRIVRDDANVKRVERGVHWEIGGRPELSANSGTVFPLSVHIDLGFRLARDIT